MKTDFDYDLFLTPYRTSTTGTTNGPFGWVFVAVEEGKQLSVCHFSPEKARKFAEKILAAADKAEKESKEHYA